MTPDGSKLYTENEEDTFGCVIDLKARKRIKKIPAPDGLAGIGMSSDGKTIVLVDAKQPQILIVDTGRGVPYCAGRCRRRDSFLLLS